jgi:uncharacterized membrane protein HdeD (DUF308 family)
MMLGIALLVIGLAAIVSPIAFGEGLVWVIGVLFIIGGCFQAYQGFRSGGSNDTVFNILMGFLTIFVGIAIAGHTLFTLSVLTVLIGIVFLVEGVWKIVVAFSARQADGWVVLLVSGILSLVLALLILRGWPDSSMYVVGILIGINLLFTGVAMIALGSTLKKVKAVIENTTQDGQDTTEQG